MKYFLAIILLLSCAFAGYYFALEKSFVNPYPIVCDLVAKKIYLEDKPIEKWHRLCLRRSRLVTPYSSRKLVIRDLNNVLGLLNVSHLEVYDSPLVKSIWRGENLETGIQSEFVDSELVIFKVHPQSPAEKLGLKKGDIIRSLNGEQPNPWDVASSSGLYVIERKNEQQKLNLRTAKVVRDDSVRLWRKAQGLQIEVPSFRAAFFEEPVLEKIAEQIKTEKNIVVDLRGNSGGNFVAGLRFLSLFICSEEEVGRLVRSRHTAENSAPLVNDLRDLEQLKILNSYKQVLLKTFPRGNCFKGSLKVLVDSKSASVAEMVAQGLKEFRHAKIWGNPSRGQLLVGVWYPLEEVGPGVEISIPEAIYESAKKHRIEGMGVELDKVLYYDLSEMQSGIDSWVKQALD